MITNRINQLFKNKKAQRLSVYFTAGYPHLEDTVSIIEALDKGGADMIEIGIPFSDPMADGKVIQNSSSIALRNGMSLKKLFAQLKDIRQHTQMPLLLMGYLNPIMHFGFEKFCAACQECGIDGLIIPDLPVKVYLEQYKSLVEKYNLCLTMLITPETSDERIRMIDEQTNGFIYMVSTASTTGTQDSFSESTQQYFSHINQMNLKNPRMIGFGISNPQTFQMANQYADGAIIGSLFIRLLGEKNTIEEAVEELVHRISL